MTKDRHGQQEVTVEGQMEPASQSSGRRPTRAVTIILAGILTGILGAYLEEAGADAVMGSFDFGS
jgi:hypothetical protein